MDEDTAAALMRYTDASEQWAGSVTKLLETLADDVARLERQIESLERLVQSRTEHLV